MVTGDHVAARLRSDGTPGEPFHGMGPTGSPVVFTEHVVPRFHDGRTTEVRSLSDGAALQRQLTRRRA